MFIIYFYVTIYSFITHIYHNPSLSQQDFLCYLEHQVLKTLIIKDPQMPWHAFKRTNKSKFIIAPILCWKHVLFLFMLFALTVSGLPVLLFLFHTHTKYLNRSWHPASQTHARYLSLSEKDGVLCRVCLLSSWAMERGMARERGGGRWERLRS